MSQLNQNLVDLVFALFDDSKFFLNSAKININNQALAESYSRASVLVAWAAFEGWVNKTSIDFAETDSELSIIEKGFLLEKKVELKNGRFVISNVDKYENIENKIEFLLNKFVNFNIDKSTLHWQNFKTSKEMRDAIIHPKKTKQYNFNIKEAELNLRALEYYIMLLSKKLYSKELNL